MSIPSIKVGQGNWGIKAGNLLGYANTEKKFSPVEFTSSRALNTATRVNQSGNIEIVNANIPRIDYFGGQSSLLVEPAATNLLSGSSDFSNTTYWTRPAGANVTGNVTGITAPDGTNTAALFQASGTTATNSRLRQTISRTTTGSHAFSVFIKGFAGVAASGSLYTDVGLIELSFAITSGGVVSLTSMTGAGAVTSGITQFPNGWYRITAVGTAATSGSTQNEIYCSPSGRQYYCWGAQLEVGSVATSYIPTTTGSVNRNADAISVTGSVSGSIGQTEGVLYIECEANTETDEIISINRQQFNSVMLLKNSNNGYVGRVFHSVSGFIGFTFTTANNITGFVKIAIAYKSGDSAMFMNGVQVGTTNTSTWAFDAPLLGVHINGFPSISNSVRPHRIRAVEIYQTRLPNTTTDGSPSLQSITTL